MVFVVLIVALALAPGLQSAATGDLPSLTTYPLLIEEVAVSPELQPQPLPIPDEETDVVPELRPLPPPVEAVVPELISINPCDACFSYMTDLIEQLTGSAVVPEIEPHPMPEVGVLPVPNPGVGAVGVGPRPLGPLLL